MQLGHVVYRLPEKCLNEPTFPKEANGKETDLRDQKFHPTESMGEKNLFKM